MEQQEDMFSSGSGGCRRTLLVCLMIVVGIAVCGSGMFVVVDGRCVSLAGTWIPVYPGSELVSMSHEYLRPFGAGMTQAQYQSSDDENVVRQWYVEHRKALGIFQDGGLANYRYSVSEAPDKSGSIITLISRCAWSE
jgi:hypothetical protein